jgi:hypothetical protein
LLWGSVLPAQSTKLYRQTLSICWDWLLINFSLFFHQTKKVMRRVQGKIITSLFEKNTPAKQFKDLLCNSNNPLFPFGFGLKYQTQ